MLLLCVAGEVVCTGCGLRLSGGTAPLEGVMRWQGSDGQGPSCDLSAGYRDTTRTEIFILYQNVSRLPGRDRIAYIVINLSGPTLSTPLEIIGLIGTDETALSNKFKKLRHRLLNVGWRFINYFREVKCRE
jgi:hypothetical protein